MIRLLDLPGASELEARLELLPAATETSDETTRQRVDGIIRFLGFRLDRWGQIETPPARHDDPFLDLDEEEDDVVGWWRSRGWDVAGRDGKLARCYRALSIPLAYIELGLCGLAKVEVEAAIWKMHRDARTPTDLKQRKQDTAFLELGARKPRPATSRAARLRPNQESLRLFRLQEKPDGPREEDRCPP